MNYSDYRFTLDVQIHQAQVSIPVTLSDTARRLYIGFTDGRKPYTIPNGCRAVFAAHKPDGNTILNDCIIENNKTVVYRFSKNTTNAEGIVDCEIRLYDIEGKELTSPQFIIVVDKKVIRDEEIPISESESTTIGNIVASELERIAAEEERKKLAQFLATSGGVIVSKEEPQESLGNVWINSSNNDDEILLLDSTDIKKKMGNSETAIMSQKTTTKSLFNVAKLHIDNIHLEQGSLYEGTEFNSANRVRSDYFAVNKNTWIEANEGYKFAISFFDSNLSYVRASTWDKNYRQGRKAICGEADIVRVVFAKEDDSNITPDEVRDNFSIYVKNPIINNLFDVPFSLGGYFYDNFDTSTNRITSDIVRLPKYTKLSTTEKFALHIHKNNTNATESANIIDSGWITEYYAEEETLVRIKIAYANDSTIEDIDALKRTLNMQVITPDLAANLNEPIFVKTIPCDVQGNLYEGVHYGGSQRIHTGFFKVEKGMILSVEGHKYAVHFYTSDTQDSWYKSTSFITKKLYKIEEDCYVRVNCANHQEDTTITAGETSVKLGWGKITQAVERPFALVAHRGLHSNNGSENKLEAFKNAGNAGFKFIENDIRWTSDNKPVLNHNADYSGVAISSRTLEEWQNEGLCSLVDCLKVCKANNIVPIIEFKTNITDEQAEYIYNLLVDMGMLNSMFLSFQERPLMRMISYYPFDVILAKNEGTVPTAEAIKSFKDIYCCGNNVYWHLFGTDFNADYYGLFIENGVKLAYGTANDNDTFNEWVAYCDMVMTDSLTTMERAEDWEV